MTTERRLVVNIDVTPPVPVTSTLYPTSCTVMEVVSGGSHIKLTLLDSVVEFLRLVAPGSTTRIQIPVHILFTIDCYYNNNNNNNRSFTTC